MKRYFLGLIGMLILGSFTNDFSNDYSNSDCDYNKDSMLVVMRFEIKVKPEYVALLKQSFEACKVEVLAKEEIKKSTEGMLPNIPGLDLSSML